MDNSGMVKKLAATAVYVPCSPGSVYDSKWKAWFTDSILKSIVGVAEGEEEDVVETENKNKIEAEVAVSNGGVVGGVGGVGVIRAVGDKGAAIVKGGVQGGVEEVHSPMVNGAAGVSLNGKATNKSASGSGSVGVPIIVSETVCVPPIAALTAAAGAAVVTQAVSGMPHQSSTSALTIIKSTPLPTPSTSTSTSSEMPKTMTKTMTEDMSESAQGHIQASAPSPAVDLSSQHTDKSGAINNVTTLPAASGVPNKSESASNIIITTAESSLQINTVKTNNTGNSAKLSKEIVSDKDVQSPLVSLLPTTESVNTTTTTAITHINQNCSDNDKNKGVGTGKDIDKDVGNSNGNSNENGNGNDNENENAGSTTIQDQSAKKYCCFSIFGFSL